MISRVNQVTPQMYYKVLDIILSCQIINLRSNLLEWIKIRLEKNQPHNINNKTLMLQAFLIPKVHNLNGNKCLLICKMKKLVDIHNHSYMINFISTNMHTRKDLNAMENNSFRKAKRKACMICKFLIIEKDSVDGN